jgi:hypothetical protein
MPVSRPITFTERRWTLAFAAIVMLLTSVPYLIGYGAQGEQAHFSGFVIGVEDGNSYIAKMHSGSAGAWLFRSPYTPYPQRGTLMFLPYLLLGKLAAGPALHEQLVALFHLFRLAAGVLAILATYDFLAYFIDKVRLRRLGLALAILGGGLGWLLVLAGHDQWLGSLPLEFYSPETFGFLGLYGFPHLALARALLLWALLIYLRAATSEGPPANTAVLKLSLVWLISGLVQPLVMLVIGALIVIHLAGWAAWMLWRPAEGRIVEWRRWRRLALRVLLAGILPGALVLYNLWLLWRDPFMAGWTDQNIIRSPHPLHYLLAYGLLLPFAWAGGRRLLRHSPVQGWLLVGWLLALPLLAYAPVNLQRRLPEGIWVAWVTLSMVALEPPGFQVDDRTRRRRVFLMGVLALALPSTLLLWAGGLITARQVDLPLFRPAGEVRVFEALRAEAPAGQIVLAAYETGNALPAWAPLRVVIGHGPESVHLVELRLQVAAFYSQQISEAQRLEFLRQFDITYVFWGPAERLLGGWDPNQALYLRPTFQAGEYSLFTFDEALAEGGTLR